MNFDFILKYGYTIFIGVALAVLAVKEIIKVSKEKDGAETISIGILAVAAVVILPLLVGIYYIIGLKALS